MRERWAITTPTDSRAQRNRAGRRGGQLLTRARSSSYGERPAHVTCSPVPLSRMVTPYANTQAGTTGTGNIMPVTNAIESLISRTRLVKRNVKRWRGGQMMLRWVAAGVLEAVKGFRRLKGYADMPTLVTVLRARDRQLGLVSAEGERQIA